MNKKILIIIFFAIIISFLIYYFTPKKSSLIYDENYIRDQINEYLKNNPTANESYARDVVYRDIARIEKNAEICEKIENEDIKFSCYNAVA